MAVDGEEKKDLILLDARLTHALSVHAFRAELSNGHELVAYMRGRSAELVPQVGAVVKVSMSPFDMSIGRMIFEDES